MVQGGAQILFFNFHPRMKIFFKKRIDSSLNFYFWFHSYIEAAANEKKY